MSGTASGGASQGHEGGGHGTSTKLIQELRLQGIKEARPSLSNSDPFAASSGANMPAVFWPRLVHWVKLLASLVMHGFLVGPRLIRDHFLGKLGIMLGRKTSIGSWISSFSSSGARAQRNLAQLRTEFVNEIRMVVHLRHPNITTVRRVSASSGAMKSLTWHQGKELSIPHVSLHAASLLPFVSLPSPQVMGACIESGREPLLVMEHMEHGSLYNLLHNSTMQLEGDIVIPMIKDIVAGKRAVFDDGRP